VRESGTSWCPATNGGCVERDAGPVAMRRVVAADGATLTLDAAWPVEDAYADGLLRWFGGRNGGLEGAIARSGA
jgi:hypothetical protein